MQYWIYLPPRYCGKCTSFLQCLVLLRTGIKTYISLHLQKVLVPLLITESVIVNVHEFKECNQVFSHLTNSPLILHQCLLKERIKFESTWLSTVNTSTLHLKLKIHYSGLHLRKIISQRFSVSIIGFN